jgi:hypothetical protein
MYPGSSLTGRASSPTRAMTLTGSKGSGTTNDQKGSVIANQMSALREMSQDHEEDGSGWPTLRNRHIL